MENLIRYAKLFEVLCNEFDQQDLGKKTTQKMFYFFERKGMDLNLRYGIHFFGPYSSKLDNTLHILESEGYISIDTSGITHKISVGATPVEHFAFSNDIAIAREVLKMFSSKSSYELEALATMDYIANFMLPKECSDTDIIKKFKIVKGDKFKDPTIKNCLLDLKHLGFIRT